MTLFHLCEFLQPNTTSAEYGGLDDRGLLDMMTDKTRPGGHILFYTELERLAGVDETILPAWEQEQPVERVDDFKTLRVYRKKR